MEPTQGRLGVPGHAQIDAIDRAGEWAATHRRSADVLISRRAVIAGGLAGIGGVLLFPELTFARAAVPSNPFVIVLKGLYQPVVHGPDLGLSTIDLDDGSYSTVPIYPVLGAPGNTDQRKAFGTFYVQFDGDLCAYHIPGGSLAMRFIGSDVNTVPDGAGGSLLTGTWELTILEATGIYRSFVGGHNQMVDTLHFLASGGVDEVACFCHISRP